MSGQVPEQAAYEAFRKAFPSEDWGPWDSPNVSDAESRDGWKSVAQAAIDARAAAVATPERWDAGTIENTETGTTWVTWDSRLPPPWTLIAAAVSRLSGGTALVRQYNDGDEDPDGRSCVVIERAAQQQPADLVAAWSRTALGLAALRSGITGLAADLDRSAAETPYALESETMRELAIALRRLLEAP